MGFLRNNSGRMAQNISNFISKWTDKKNLKKMKKTRKKLGFLRKLSALNWFRASDNVISCADDIMFALIVRNFECLELTLNYYRWDLDNIQFRMSFRSPTSKTIHVT